MTNTNTCIELSNENIEYLRRVLDREYTSTLVEMHHTDHNDFRNIVKAKERQIEDLMTRIKSLN